MPLGSLLPKSVLLIDDDEAVCDVLRMALEDDGYRVRCCGDPSVGMAAILDEPPDLVIVDWKIYQPDGERLFDAVRSAERLSVTPVLIAVPTGRWKTRREDLVGPKTEVLLKPFELEELMAIVQRMTDVDPALAS